MLPLVHRLGLATLALGLLGCQVAERPEEPQRGAYLPCRNDADCASGGMCLAEPGICTTAVGRLSTILFEIAPQPTQESYGSVVIFKTVRGLAQSSAETLVLDVPQRLEVKGRVDAAPEQKDCTNGATSLPVSLVFTPREHLFGL